MKPVSVSFCTYTWSGPVVNSSDLLWIEIIFFTCHGNIAQLINCFPYFDFCLRVYIWLNMTLFGPGVIVFDKLFQITFVHTTSQGLETFSKITDFNLPHSRAVWRVKSDELRDILFTVQLHCIAYPNCNQRVCHWTSTSQTRTRRRTCMDPGEPKTWTTTLLSSSEHQGNIQYQCSIYLTCILRSLAGLEDWSRDMLPPSG